MLRIFLVVAGAIAVLILSGYFAVRLYRHTQEKGLYREASASIARGDFPAAAAAAQRAAVLNPQSAEANRLLAQVSDHFNSQTALDYWRKAVDLGGNTDGDLLDLAKSAIRFHESNTAAAALSRLPDKAQKSAQYHALRGDIALLRGKVQLYENEVEQSQKIDPANRAYALALATLHAANEKQHAQGVAELETLAQDATTRHDANRHLAEDAVRHQDWPRALKQTERLEGLADRTFGDRLLRLTSLKGANDPALEAAIAQLQNECRKDPEKAAALMSWLTSAGRAGDVLKWGATLPEKSLREKTVPLAFADALLASRDWAGLHKFLEKTDWGAADYMRSALLARAGRELNRPTEFERRWAEATRKVSGRSEQTLLLAETAKKWRWESEAIDLFWIAAKDPANAERTLAALYRYFSARGDTKELYRVMSHLLELHPLDRSLENNVAQLALLLGFEPERAYRLAEAVYTADPRNPDFAATYAFSLWRQGRPKKARQILDQLPEHARSRPAIAAYYGAILVANGDRDAASQSLERSDRATLLPEEKAMVAKAREDLASR